MGEKKATDMSRLVLLVAFLAALELVCAAPTKMAVDAIVPEETLGDAIKTEKFAPWPSDNTVLTEGQLDTIQRGVESLRVDESVKVGDLKKALGGAVAGVVASKRARVGKEELAQLELQLGITYVKGVTHHAGDKIYFTKEESESNTLETGASTSAYVKGTIGAKVSMPMCASCAETKVSASVETRSTLAGTWGSTTTKGQSATTEVICEANSGHVFHFYRLEINGEKQNSGICKHTAGDPECVPGDFWSDSTDCKAPSTATIPMPPTVPAGDHFCSRGHTELMMFEHEKAGPTPFMKKITETTETKPARRLLGGSDETIRGGFGTTVAVPLPTYPTKQEAEPHWQIVAGPYYGAKSLAGNFAFHVSSTDSTSKSMSNSIEISAQAETTTGGVQVGIEAGMAVEASTKWASEHGSGWGEGKTTTCASSTYAGRPVDGWAIAVVETTFTDFTSYDGRKTWTETASKIVPSGVTFCVPIIDGTPRYPTCAFDRALELDAFDGILPSCEGEGIQQPKCLS